jgi:hemerythrin-like domain-containing protein
MISQAAASLHVPKRSLALAAVWARVLEEHQQIRRLLDDVERAAGMTKAQQPAALDRLHHAIWELYVALDEHLAFEERDLGPLLEALLPAGHVTVREMVLEHNEQRDALLRLVEDSETDARNAGELAEEALATVIRFRIDIVVEERALSVLVPSASAPNASPH